MMVYLGNRFKLKQMTLKEHNNSLLSSNQILTGKEFRRLRRKKK